MNREKEKDSPFIKEVKRRKKILEKSEEFRKRIEAINVPEVRCAS